MAKKGEMVVASTQEDLKKEIMDELLSLDTIIKVFYSKLGIVHKTVVHLNGWQQRCDRRESIFLNVHIVFDYMKIWTIRYKRSLL